VKEEDEDIAYIEQARDHYHEMQIDQEEGAKYVMSDEVRLKILEIAGRRNMTAKNVQLELMVCKERI